MEFKDFTELSINARELFTMIDRMSWVYGEGEGVDVTKEELAFLTGKSVPSIKVSLRELKQTGYIWTEHVNDTVLMIGKPYGFQTVEKGEYHVNNKSKR